MSVEIWLTDKYYEDFQERKDSLFSSIQAVDVYKQTQLLMQNWPTCMKIPPPEVGTKYTIFYVKNDWPGCTLRICFGAVKENNIDKIVALTCRTKQELSKGSSNGTVEWYNHMATFGFDRWDSYKRGKLKSWKIYP